MLFDHDFFRPSMVFANRPMVHPSLFAMARPRTPPSSFFDADEGIRASRERVQREIAQLKQLYDERRKQWQEEQEQQEQQEEQEEQEESTDAKPSSYSVSTSEYHSSDVNGEHSESSKSMHKAVKPSPDVGYEFYECKNGKCFGFRVYIKPNVVREWHGGDREGADIRIGVDANTKPKMYKKKLHSIMRRLAKENEITMTNKMQKEVLTNVKKKMATSSNRKKSSKRTRSSSESSAQRTSRSEAHRPGGRRTRK